MDATGSLLLTNRQYAFARFTEDQGLLTAVNNDEQEAEMYIPVPFSDKTYVDLETGKKRQWKMESCMYPLKLQEACSWKYVKGTDF